ncbi:MAG: hypothetical protein LC624_01300 [Halobacteriales archaeon]|nr:hypothetical protein [Halobacteriales archaeon]
MIIDPVSTGIGLVIGVLVTVFVRELVFKTVQNEEHTKLTAHWSLSEHSGGKPVKLCTEHIGAIGVPAGSQLLVSRDTRVPEDLRKRCEVRVSARIQSNFALGDDRALVFASAVRPGALAVWTFEEQVLQRLSDEWARAWADSEPMVAQVELSGLRELMGQTVEVHGSVSDVAEKGGVHYLRLLDGHGFLATVASDAPISAAKGSMVRVIGTVDRSLVGKEPILRAVKVERLAHSVAITR